MKIIQILLIMLLSAPLALASEKHPILRDTRAKKIDCYPKPEDLRPMLIRNVMNMIWDKIKTLNQ